MSGSERSRRGATVGQTFLRVALLTGIALLAFPLAPFIPQGSGPAWHGALEIALACVAAGIAFVSYGKFLHSGEVQELVVGSAFLAVVVTNVIHAVSFPGFLGPLSPLPGGSGFEPGMWTHFAVGAFIAAGLLGAILVPERWRVLPSLCGPSLFVTMTLTLLLSGGVTWGLAVAAQVGGLPEYVSRWGPLTRPLELMLVGVLGLLFARLAARPPRGVTPGLRAGLLCAIGLLIGSEIALAFSGRAFDANFLLAHFLKAFALSAALVGVFGEHIALYREERTTRAAAERTAARLRALIDGANYGIAILDLDGYVRDVNPAGARLLGHLPEDVMGRHFTEFLRAGDVPDGLTAFDRVLKGESMTGRLGVARPEGGHALVEYASSRVAFEGGEFIQLQFQDVSEEARLIAELAQAGDSQRLAIERLRLLNRELEDYTFTVAHDVSEPLRGIEALAGYLLQDDGLPGEDREVVERIRDNADRLKARVRGMLDFARATRSDEPLEETDLEAVVASAVETLRTQAETRGAEIRVEGPLPRVPAQRLRIEQVVSNLVENALKYNDKPRPVIEITAEEGVSRWRVWVRDNGIGIAPEHRERIFEVFQRGPHGHEYRGAGAGLAIVKKIIEQHGGEVGVESSPGEGSAFWFTLPKSTPGAAAVVPAARARPTASY